MRTTLDPTLDIVFKLLFALRANREALVSLLTAVLRPPVPIAEVHVLNPEINREQVDDKGIVLDLLVVLADGTRIDVEMQADRRSGFRHRVLYYWSRVFVSQLERGQPYTALRPVVCILFLDYVEFDTPHFHSTFRVLEGHEHFPFSNALELHVIELPKRNDPRGGARQEDADLLNWVRFLGAKTDEEVKEACMSNPAIAKANEYLTHLSASPSAQELARQRQLALDTYRIEMTAAKEEGLSEGEKKGEKRGEKKGRVESLLRILDRRFGPVPNATRARVMAADPSELDGWLDRAIDAPTLDAVFTAAH